MSNLNNKQRSKKKASAILQFRGSEISNSKSVWTAKWRSTPPPKKKKKKQKKNVVAKTNDIVIYASRCITTFSELSKVFIHFILKKKTWMNCSITDSIDNSYFCTQIDKQEMTEQHLGRKMVQMKNSSMKNTSKTSHQLIMFISA